MLPNIKCAKCLYALVPRAFGGCASESTKANLTDGHEWRIKTEAMPSRFLTKPLNNQIIRSHWHKVIHCLECTRLSEMRHAHQPCLLSERARAFRFCNMFALSKDQKIGNTRQLRFAVTRCDCALRRKPSRKKTTRFNSQLENKPDWNKLYKWRYEKMAARGVSTRIKRWVSASTRRCVKPSAPDEPRAHGCLKRQTRAARGELKRRAAQSGSSVSKSKCRRDVSRLFVPGPASKIDAKRNDARDLFRLTPTDFNLQSGRYQAASLRSFSSAPEWPWKTASSSAVCPHLRDVAAVSITRSRRHTRRAY
eukprot:4941036-Pleurochrysis_carterae.AAC.1